MPAAIIIAAFVCGDDPNDTCRGRDRHREDEECRTRTLYHSILLRREDGDAGSRRGVSLERPEYIARPSSPTEDFVNKRLLMLAVAARPSHHYSIRNAVVGSRRVARCAGTIDAVNAAGHQHGARHDERHEVARVGAHHVVLQQATDCRRRRQADREPARTDVLCRSSMARTCRIRIGLATDVLRLP
jgi:hypothetical protein